jgi:hypothetical protein
MKGSPRLGGVEWCVPSVAPGKLSLSENSFMGWWTGLGGSEALERLEEREGVESISFASDDSGELEVWWWVISL